MNSPVWTIPSACTGRLFLSGKYFQKFGNCQYLNPVVLLDCQQVFIPADYVKTSAIFCTGKKLIVIGIPADFNLTGRVDDFHC